MEPEQKSKLLRPDGGSARAHSLNWKTAQSLLRFVTPEQFDDIVAIARRRDHFIADSYLEMVLSEILEDTGTRQKMKDFLVKTHILSVILREKGNADDELEIWYVPNVSLQEEVNQKILVLLKNELLQLMPRYRNKTSHGISVYYLKRDYGAYLARTMTYDLEKIQIRLGVMIASLYDALLARGEDAHMFVAQYFNDDMKGKYNIISGDLSRNREVVAADAREVLRLMYRMAAGESDPSEVEPDQEIGKKSAWIEVYRRLSRNPATRIIRESMSHAIERFILSEQPIGEDTFREYVRDLADIYMNTFDIEKLREDEYKARIVKVIQYIYARNLEICSAIRGAIDKAPVDEVLVDAFIYWVVEISLKMHQDFLNSLIKKYHLFYYLYIRAYFAHRGLEDSPSSHSFFIILKNLFCIKHSDSRLVREVLARNRVEMP